MEMTKDVVRKICRDLKLYATPEVNDKLYLHYKGFRAIENLDEYVGLRVLYLEGNGIVAIQGLDKLTELRSLYLHENCISEMCNLDTLKHLDTLNLSNNMISKIQGSELHLKKTNFSSLRFTQFQSLQSKSDLLPGLDNLQALTTLLLANNKLKFADDIAELFRIASTLSVLDISQNLLDDGDAVIATLSQLPNLRVLYLKGNPFVARMQAYRKTLISSIAAIKYLDDRPVFPDEKSCAEAWVRGGHEAELSERVALREAREADDRRRAASFEQMLGQAREGEPQVADDTEDDSLFGDGLISYEHEVGADDEDGGDEVPDLEIVGLKVNSLQQQGEKEASTGIAQQD